MVTITWNFNLQFSSFNLMPKSLTSLRTVSALAVALLHTPGSSEASRPQPPGSTTLRRASLNYRKWCRKEVIAVAPHFYRTRPLHLYIPLCLAIKTLLGETDFSVCDCITRITYNHMLPQAYATTVQSSSWWQSIVRKTDRNYVTAQTSQQVTEQIRLSCFLVEYYN